MNPNVPPPKNTEVTITKWEYTDPVGVPHPDVVDIVLALKNEGSETISNLEVEVAHQWKVGPLDDPEHAIWTERSVLRQVRGTRVEPAQTQILRVPVDLKNKMDVLGQQQTWPHALRVTAAIRLVGADEALQEVQGDLPIRAGD